jgi:hypothetical protein
MTKLLIMMILILAQGCAGYRFSQQGNPLAQYGISSLSIPMFYNLSNQPELSGVFTRKASELFSDFPDLKVVSGLSTETDAVLIGILHSQEKIFQSQVPTVRSSAEFLAPKAIGEKRKDFSVPSATSLRLQVQYVIIKKPTEAELALLRSELGAHIPAQDKVIVNERLPLEIVFNRDFFDEEATAVIGTHNAGIQRKSVEAMATQATAQFRDLILYAF